MLSSYLYTHAMDNSHTHCPVPHHTVVTYSYNEPEKFIQFTAVTTSLLCLDMLTYISAIYIILQLPTVFSSGLDCIGCSLGATLSAM